MLALPWQSTVCVAVVFCIARRCDTSPDTVTSILESPLVGKQKFPGDWISGRKRGALFPSGVRLCAEETVQQVIANHLNYFHLRVCQETVWEAFKIFWDRLPKRDEYQGWLTLCLDGSTSILEIGSRFSQSEEHQSLVKSRMSMAELHSPGAAVSPSEEATSTPQEAEEMDALSLETLVLSATPEPTTMVMVPAEWPEQPLVGEVVHLSVWLKGGSHSDFLNDPSSARYQHLAQKFTHKLEDAFKGLSGFKGVFGLKFREHMDGERNSVVATVHYAVILRANTDGISNKTLDFLRLQSRFVAEAYPWPDEGPTAFSTVTDSRTYIAEVSPEESSASNNLLVVDADLMLRVEASIKPSTALASAEMDNVRTSEKPLRFAEQEFSLKNISSGFSRNESMLEAALPRGFLRQPQGGPAGYGNIDLELHPSEPGLSKMAPADILEEVGSIYYALDFSDFMVPSEGPSVLEARGLLENVLDTESGSSPSGDELLQWLPEMTGEDLRVPESGQIEVHNSSLRLLEENGLFSQSIDTFDVQTPFLEDFYNSLVITRAEESEKYQPTKEPFLSRVPVTNTQPQHMITEASPVFWTMESLTVERTDEASGIYDDFNTENLASGEFPSMITTATTSNKTPVFDLNLVEQASGQIVEKLIFAIDPNEQLVINPFTDAEQYVLPVTEEDEEVQNLEVVQAEDVLTESTATEISVQDITNDKILIASRTTRWAEVTESLSPTYLSLLSSFTHVTHVVPEEEQFPILSTSTDNTSEVPFSDVSKTYIQTTNSTEGKEDDAIDRPFTEPLIPRHSYFDLNLDKDIGHKQRLTQTPLYVEKVTVTTRSALVTESFSPVTQTSFPSKTATPFITVSDDVPGGTEPHTESASNTKSSATFLDLPEDTEMAGSVKATIVPDASKISTGSIASGDLATILTEFTNSPPFHQPKLRPTENMIGLFNEEDDISGVTVEPVLTEPSSHNKPESYPDKESATLLKMQTYGLDNDLFDVFYLGGTSLTKDEDTEHPTSTAQGTELSGVSMPGNQDRALIVFFSLRVTNMIFSEDLFNKSSPEYNALEQRFLELLVPYLQSNLSNFRNLEILNFRNGSIVVNSRMKIGKPVPRSVINSIYLILTEFCNAAYQTTNLAIDKYSLDVESGDQADPCKFQACNEFSKCLVNRWSGEVECVCDPGYLSVDGLPCQSICELQQEFCLNDGKCDIIPGQGAICRCRVEENRWFRGEHCEEYVTELLVMGIAVASLAAFLLLTLAVLFFLARMMRDQYHKDDLEDPVCLGDSMLSSEWDTKYQAMCESEGTARQGHRYGYPDTTSSGNTKASSDTANEEIQHIYQNSELTKEKIQDRIWTVELHAKDGHFPNFGQRHEVALDIQNEHSSI